MKLRLDTLHELLELTLHRTNNRLTVGSSQVDLLMMMPGKGPLPEHLDTLARVFRETAQLHVNLIKQSRRFLSFPTIETHTGLWLDQLTPMLDLVARSTHRTIVTACTPEAQHGLIPGELGVWVEILLFKLCRLPHEGDRLSLHLDMAPPSIHKPWLHDTRQIVPHASHLHITLSPVVSTSLPPRHVLHEMLGHMLTLVPGACWLDDSSHTLHLELAISRQMFTSAPTTPPPEESSKKTHTPRVHCLLIDDEPAMLGPLKRILKYQGYEVSAFTSPAEAIAHITLHALTFDIALIDYAMNELNGLQTLEALRCIQPELPAIIITGMPDDTLLDTLEGDPLSSSLSKPWEMTSLLELISTHLASD